MSEYVNCSFGDKGQFRPCPLMNAMLKSCTNSGIGAKTLCVYVAGSGNFNMTDFIGFTFTRQAVSELPELKGSKNGIFQVCPFCQANVRRDKGEKQ